MIGAVTLHEDGPAWLSLVVFHQVLAKQRIDPSTTEVTYVLRSLGLKVPGPRHHFRRPPSRLSSR